MLGTLIKEYMRNNGIKQSYVADKIGMSPQTLGQVLNGNRKIEAKEFFDLCEAIGVDAAEFAQTAGIYKRKMQAIAAEA